MGFLKSPPAVPVTGITKGGGSSILGKPRHPEALARALHGRPADLITKDPGRRTDAEWLFCR